MNQEQRPLWLNLNRLAMVAFVLLALKLFAYFVQDFLPIFGQVLRHLISAFLPFIIALLIAYLLEPLVRHLIKILHLRRPYASLLTLIATIAVVGLFIFLIVARLYTELSELAVSLPNYGSIIDLVSRQVDAVEKFVKVNPQVQSTLFTSTESLLKSVQEWAKSGSLMLLGFLAALPGIFIVTVVSIVATLLVSSSFPSVRHFLEGLFPKRWHGSAQIIGQDLGSALVGFLRAEAILVSVTTVTTILGLILIGNRYAVTIGVLTGIMDLIPVVGTGLLYVPWIVGLFLFGAMGEGLKLLVMWVTTVVLRQFLEPKIMSKNIGLHPLPTLISMYVGLQLLGGVGLILGPTVVIVYEAMRKAGIFNWPKA